MRDAESPAALSRESIIEAALALLDDVGLDGLTVRRLATALDVRNPTLYWHFRDKQELLDGLADAIVRAAGMGPPHKGESWQRWLRRRARAYRDSLLSHRDAARVVSSARSLSDNALLAFEEELTVLVGRGFSPALALRTITAVSAYTEGFVLREQRPAATPPASDNVRGRDDLPILMEALLESGRTGHEAVFEHGLRAIIDGGANALARRRTQRDS